MSERTSATRLDGCGEPVVDANLYYVADARQVVGNCILWWCWQGKGYTCELGRAGWYTGAEVRAMRDTDQPWPIGYVDARTVTHVRRDRLRDAADTHLPEGTA